MSAAQPNFLVVHSWFHGTVSNYLAPPLGVETLEDAKRWVHEFGSWVYDEEIAAFDLPGNIYDVALIADVLRAMDWDPEPAATVLDGDDSEWWIFARLTR